MKFYYFILIITVIINSVFAQNGNVAINECPQLNFNWHMDIQNILHYSLEIISVKYISGNEFNITIHVLGSEQIPLKYLSSLKVIGVTGPLSKIVLYGKNENTYLIDNPTNFTATFAVYATFQNCRYIMPNFQIQFEYMQGDAAQYWQTWEWGTSTFDLSTGCDNYDNQDHSQTDFPDFYWLLGTPQNCSEIWITTSSSSILPVSSTMAGISLSRRRTTLLLSSTVPTTKSVIDKSSLSDLVTSTPSMSVASTSSVDTSIFTLNHRSFSRGIRISWPSVFPSDNYFTGVPEQYPLSSSDLNSSKDTIVSRTTRSNSHTIIPGTTNSYSQGCYTSVVTPHKYTTTLRTITADTTSYPLLESTRKSTSRSFSSLSRYTIPSKLTSPGISRTKWNNSSTFSTIYITHDSSSTNSVTQGVFFNSSTQTSSTTDITKSENSITFTTHLYFTSIPYRSLATKSSESSTEMTPVTSNTTPTTYTSSDSTTLNEQNSLTIESKFMTSHSLYFSDYSGKSSNFNRIPLWLIAISIILDM